MKKDSHKTAKEKHKIQAIIFPKGEKYVGQWKNGVREGQVRFIKLKYYIGNL